MIIQNKRGEQKSIRPQDWEKMEQMGYAAGWSILSNEETVIRKSVPKEIVDFKTIIKKNHGRKDTGAVPGNQDV